MSGVMIISALVLWSYRHAQEKRLQSKINWCVSVLENNSGVAGKNSTWSTQPAPALIALSLNKYYCVLLQLFQFFSLCSPLPTPPPAPTVNPHPVVHVHIHGSFMHVPWLVSSRSFCPCNPPSSPVITVSLFLVSMPLVQFCLFVCLFCSSCSSYRWDHCLSLPGWLHLA